MNTHRLTIVVCTIAAVGTGIMAFLSIGKPTQVVVNMSADAKPLASLAPVVSPDAKVITQERAVLWWTVYHATMDKVGMVRLSVEAADAAVDKVYGPAKP